MDKEYVEFKIKVSGITRRDAKRLSGLLRTMQYLGGIGASRVVNFYCDGDGDFRPKFEIEEAYFTKKEWIKEGQKRPTSIGKTINRYISEDEDDPTLS